MIKPSFEENLSIVLTIISRLSLVIAVMLSGCMGDVNNVRDEVGEVSVPITRDEQITSRGADSAGIGLILEKQQEFVVIKDIIAGGPAAKSGLAAGDAILAVGQGPTGEMKDVIGWDIRSVLDEIRGLKGSIVRLRVVREGLVHTYADSRMVTLVRANIKLEEQLAKGYTIEVVSDDTPMRIGVIELSKFYRDFNAESKGKQDFLSTARDVKRILGALKQRGVTGIVLDLWGNPGGPLTEATEVAGLFIESGDIVQVRDATGKVEVEKDTDPGIAYSGPLAVLVDHRSAGASEIVAAAVQDYGRGMVIGERTYGLGSVQTLVNLNRFIPGSKSELGILRLTMAEFFRPNGDGIQQRGVVPDIVFPTDNNSLPREQTLANSLPWSQIAPIRTPDCGFTMNPQVTKRHQARTRKDPVFRLSVELNQLVQSLDERTSVSLNESRRIAEQKRLDHALASITQKLRQHDKKGEAETALEIERNAALQEAATILADCTIAGCYRR
jgi:carboxyl-terminal processing protease